MTGRLSGKRALVTGGGAGIGRAAAIKLAAEGARVGVVDLNLQGAKEVAADISNSGGEAIALKADVSKEDEIRGAVDAAERHFGGLDTLVVNAGVMLFGRDTIATELDLGVWQRCIDVNLTGMFLTCKNGLKALERAGGGAVVITGSPTGSLGCAPTYTAYSASKAGTFGLMRILAVDYVKKHIRVNAVLPGTTNSPLVATLMENPTSRAEFMAKIPMGRPAEPQEIANTIAYLASDEASYVTGAAWYSDGGLSAI
jgi:NAD(P)-dependent dehydrogenase (short-subunit alcohol dehydrogenase family)